MSDSELSTTTGGSDTESGSESTEPESKQNLESTAASAREEFKKLTEATDKKNAALTRDLSTHSFDSREAEQQEGEGKSGVNAKPTVDSDDDSDSGSTDSESTSSVVSPKPPRDSPSGGSRNGNEEGTVVTGQHHDEELDMR